MVCIAKMLGLRPAWFYGGEIVLSQPDSLLWWGGLVDEGRRVDAIYLSFVKAFDAVSMISS